MNARTRLSKEHRRILEDYVQDLEKRQSPLPGTRVGDVAAIDWQGVAEATGLPKELLFRHLEEAKAILEPHLQDYGVTTPPPQLDAKSVEQAARTYLQELRQSGRGIPALPRKRGAYFDWKTIAEEMGLPYAHIEAHHHLLRALFRAAEEDLGHRWTHPPEPRERPRRADPLKQALEAYIDELRASGRGVPVRCLRLRPALNWTVFCREFDCSGIATTAHRRDVIAATLLEAASKLGVRFGSKADKDLCAVAQRLRDALQAADVETLSRVVTPRGRLRWAALAELIDEPLDHLKPLRLRLHRLVEDLIGERMAQAEKAEQVREIARRAENLVARLRQKGAPTTFLTEDGRLILERLAREMRVSADALRAHQPWLEPWLRSCFQDRHMPR